MYMDIFITHRWYKKTTIYTQMYKIYKQFIAYGENIHRFHKTA